MPLGSQVRSCAITINGSTEVSGSHSDYTVFINHDEMPSESLDADGSYPMNADGGDIRVFSDSALTTEIPRDIIHVSLDNDPANSLFLMAIKVSSLTTANKIIYVAYNDSGASDYNRTDTYGRDNAYDSNWKLFYPMIGSWNGTADEVVDRTVNANDGQGGAGVANKVPSRVSFGLLYGQDYDDVAGQEDMTNTLSSSSLDITGAITILIHVNRAAGDASFGTILYKGNAAGTTAGTSYGIFLDAADKPLVIMYSPAVAHGDTADNALVDGTDNVVSATWDGTGAADSLKHYLNGASNGTWGRAVTPMTSHANPFTTGTMTGGSGNPYEGKLTFASIHNTDRSSDWQATYYNNVEDIANFLTVGTPEDIVYPGDGLNVIFYGNPF